VQIAATLTGGPSWTVVWSPGNITQTVSASPAVLTVQPDVTTQYTISQISDGSGCAGVISGEAVVTVAPPAPTQFSASATTGTTVQLGWSFAGSADHFALDRCGSACSLASSWAEIGTTAQLSYVDAVATANKSYLYRVRARKGGTSSLPSSPDLATTVIPIDAVSGTMIDDAQIMQLRTAVQAVSLLAGSPPPTMTGTNLANALILSVHLGELRSALNAARASLNLPAVVYSVSTSSVRAADVNELNGGVR
jgi:hypothetical protein